MTIESVRTNASGGIDLSLILRTPLVITFSNGQTVPNGSKLPPKNRIKDRPLSVEFQ